MTCLRIRALTCATMLCAIGCANETTRLQAPANEVAAWPEAKGAGTMLAALSVEGVRVEFREMQPGVISRVAYGNAANAAVLDRLTELGGQGLLASELYEALAPDREIPIELLEAEARSSEELGAALIAPLPGDSSELPGSSAHDDVDDVEGGELDLPQVENGEVGVVSPELTSGETFYGNYCGNAFLPLLLFDKSVCQTDVIRYASESWKNPLKSMYWVSYVMNATESTGGPASYLFQWKPGNTWETFASGTLAPGQWTWSDWPYVSQLYSEVNGFEGPFTPVKVHGYESYRNGPPVISHKFTYPRTAAREYANDIQGVTHDGSDTYWYSACKTAWTGGNCESRIWRRDDDSTQIPDSLTWTSYPSDWSSTNLWGGSGLETHYGALTWGIPANSTSDARIFVPISPPGGSNASCYVGIFNAALTKYFAPAGLNVPSCPFMAYNPTNGLFYTIYDSKLYMYRITASGYSAGSHAGQFSNAVLVTPLGGASGSTFNGLVLKDAAGQTFKFSGVWVQGGAFGLPKPTAGARNKIYVVAQSTKTDGGPGATCGTTGTGNKCTGIYAIDVITGIVQSYTHIGVEGEYSDGVDGFDEELEGIAVNHMTGPSYYHPDCTASNCDTDYHLLILKNEITNDSMIMRHYTASSLSGL